MCLPQVLPALDFDRSQVDADGGLVDSECSRVDSDGGLVDSESSLVDSDDFYMGIICQFQCDAGSSRKLCTFERHWVKYPVVVINSLYFQFTEGTLLLSLSGALLDSRTWSALTRITSS